MGNPRLIKSVSEMPCTKCPYSGECEKLCEKNSTWLTVKHYVAYHFMSFGKCSIYTAINIQHKEKNKLVRKKRFWRRKRKEEIKERG